MNVQELVARFPEIPPDLRDDPLLARFAEVFDPLLRVARNPSACSSQHDPANHYYVKLIGPLTIYGYGLATRERVLSDIRDLLQRQQADPDGFAASLVPPDASGKEVRGPGCG